MKDSFLSSIYYNDFHKDNKINIFKKFFTKFSVNLYIKYQKKKSILPMKLNKTSQFQQSTFQLLLLFNINLLNAQNWNLIWADEFNTNGKY